MRRVGISAVTIAVAVALAVGPPAASQAQTSPTQPAAPRGDAAQRAADLIALIEGPNSPQARATGARELLRLEWPDSRQRIASILRGTNVAARTALATALGELREYLHPEYVEPLLTMLGESDVSAVRAASVALASYSAGESAVGLRRLVLDPATPGGAFQAAVDALIAIAHRDGVATLVELLSTASSPRAAEALSALEHATGVSFAGDREAARAWWAANQGASADEWQRAQIRRLLDRQVAAESTARALEARLTRALRDLFLAAAEVDRAAILNSMLSDSLVSVRLLALELADAELVEGRTPTEATLASIRGLLTDSEATVRSAAVRVVSNMRAPDDARALASMLAVENDADVRIALVNALGFVGDAAAGSALLALIDAPDGRLGNAAVAAAARLAERGVLSSSDSAALVARLPELLSQAPREAVERRERLVWAMSRLPHAAFADAFVASLDPSEAVPVRQAAARGLAALADRRFISTLVQTCRDPDPLVRKVAVEALPRLGGENAIIEALWSRLAAADEPDASVRDAAWTGVVRLMGERPIDEVEGWLARLPPNGDGRVRRSVDLLQVIESRLRDRADARGRLGRVRARLAAQFALLSEPEAASAAWLAALDDLEDARDSELDLAAGRALAFAATTGADGVGARVRLLNGRVDVQRVWNEVVPAITTLLDAQKFEAAEAALRRLATGPIGPWPAPIAAELDALLRRAMEGSTALTEKEAAAALDRLRVSPGDEAALAALARCDARAVPIMRAALLEVLSSAAPDANYERLLHDLLKERVPGWSGFSPDATPEQKRATLDGIPTSRPAE